MPIKQDINSVYLSAGKGGIVCFENAAVHHLIELMQSCNIDQDMLTASAVGMSAKLTL